MKTEIPQIKYFHDYEIPEVYLKSNYKFKCNFPEKKNLILHSTVGHQLLSIHADLSILQSQR